jgi:hypothetical protein
LPEARGPAAISCHDFFASRQAEYLAWAGLHLALDVSLGRELAGSRTSAFGPQDNRRRQKE